MKKRMIILMILGFVLNSKAYANDCDLGEDTAAFSKKFKKLYTVHSIKNEATLTPLEREIIQHVVQWTEDNFELTQAASLIIFQDHWGENDGYNAGSIRYYSTRTKDENTRYALATYYPGENEYGLIFKVKKNEKYELIAEVSDAFIMNCVE